MSPTLDYSHESENLEEFPKFLWKFGGKNQNLGVDKWEIHGKQSRFGWYSWKSANKKEHLL